MEMKAQSLAWLSPRKRSVGISTYTFEMASTSPMILGLDLDGVVADYTSALRASITAHRGVPEESITNEPAGWDFPEWDLAEGEFLEHHQRAVSKERMFRTMQPIKDASRNLWLLSDADIHIRVITRRLQFGGGHAVAASDTVTWLDEHDIPYRDISFLGRSGYTDKSQVLADLYIDDSPADICRLREANKPVLIWDHAYNRDLGNPRVDNWDDAMLMIREASEAFLKFRQCG